MLQDYKTYMQHDNYYMCSVNYTLTKRYMASERNLMDKQHTIL